MSRTESIVVKEAGKAFLALILGYHGCKAKPVEPCILLH